MRAELGARGVPSVVEMQHEGGAAGALPPVIGWAAARGSLDGGAFSACGTAKDYKNLILAVPVAVSISIFLTQYAPRALSRAFSIR